jgi:hypothetical protein
LILTTRADGDPRQIERLSERLDSKAYRLLDTNQTLGRGDRNAEAS